MADNGFSVLGSSNVGSSSRKTCYSLFKNRKGMAQESVHTNK